MDTNKNITLPHPNNSTLIFKKKSPPLYPPPQNLNFLKNQHPSPAKKPSKSPRSGDLIKTVHVL